MDSPSQKYLNREIDQIVARIVEIEAKESFLRVQRFLQGPDPYFSE